MSAHTPASEKASTEKASKVLDLLLLVDLQEAQKLIDEIPHRFYGSYGQYEELSMAIEEANRLISKVYGWFETKQRTRDSIAKAEGQQ